MSLRRFLPVLVLACPGILYAADLFTDSPSVQSDAQRASQGSMIDRLKTQRNTVSATAVGVNTDALNGGPVTINLPSAKLKATFKKIERRSPDDFTWYGELPGQPGTATLVVRGSRVTGTIRSGKDLYRIVSPAEGSHVLVKIKEGAFPPDHPPEYAAIAANAVPPGAKGMVPDAAGEPIIDVMVTWTPSARTRAGDIVGLVQLAIDETNQAYLNSRINPRVRLVHAYETNYSETGRSFSTILGHLRSTNDSNFQNVHALRNQYGADVVVAIVNQDDSCGIASAIMANESNAFAVAHWDCATGYYTFGHEIGHLQGARHDPDTDSSTTPFAYGHGYRYKQEWRTVMAYDCPDDCPRLQYFSSPRVLYNGVKMGNRKKSNNAKVINETANTVAGFRPTAP